MISMNSRKIVDKCGKSADFQLRNGLVETREAQR